MLKWCSVRGSMLVFFMWIIAMFPSLGFQSDSGVTFGTTVFSSAGFHGRIYFLEPETAQLPDFRSLQPAGDLYTPVLNVPPQRWTKGFPGVTSRFEWFAIEYTGNFWIEKAGLYRFQLTSDDGALLFIDGQLILDNDLQHPPATKSASLRLGYGLHHIRVPYFQGPRDTVALVLKIAGVEDNALRVFNLDEFKAPVNPESWGKPADVCEGAPVVPFPESTAPVESGHSGSTKTFRTTVVAAGGLTGHIYKLRGLNVDRTKVEETFQTASVRLPPDEVLGRFIGKRGLSKPFAAEYSGNFWIEQPGLYRFAHIVEDGGRLWVDDQLIGDDNPYHLTQPGRRYASIQLCRGTHRLRYVYLHTHNINAELKLLISVPGQDFREFNTEELRP